MCKTCGKHLAEKVWYLEPEQHRIRSLGLLQDTASRHIDFLLVNAIRFIRKKQRYGQDRLIGISRNLVDWVTRTFHGGQVLPDSDTAFEVIDMANEIVLMPCICHKALLPKQPPAWKCIGLNIASRIYYQTKDPKDFKVIGKQQAREVISEWRARGAFQTACWLWNANVSWICNCDQHCISHRLHELDWGIVPSLFVARLDRPQDCTGCRTCARWCSRPDALTFGPDHRVHVNPALCRGCGICIEHCPQHALGYAPRQVYYDIMQKKIRTLEPELVSL